jgi:hypothetical protein
MFAVPPAVLVIRSNPRCCIGYVDPSPTLLRHTYSAPTELRVIYFMAPVCIGWIYNESAGCFG